MTDKKSNELLIPLSLLQADELNLRRHALRAVTDESMGLSWEGSPVEILCGRAEETANVLRERGLSDASIADTIYEVWEGEGATKYKEELRLEQLGRVLWLAIYGVDATGPDTIVRSEVLDELRRIPNDRSTEVHLDSVMAHNQVIDLIMNPKPKKPTAIELARTIADMEGPDLRIVLESAVDRMKEEGIGLSELVHPRSAARGSAGADSMATNEWRIDTPLSLYADSIAKLTRLSVDEFEKQFAEAVVNVPHVVLRKAFQLWLDRLSDGKIEGVPQKEDIDGRKEFAGRLEENATRLDQAFICPKKKVPAILRAVHQTDRDIAAFQFQEFGGKNKVLSTDQNVPHLKLAGRPVDARRKWGTPKKEP